MAVGITKLNPVVYCGGLVGGNTNEYSAPEGASAEYTINVGNPAGTKVIDAWYQPQHNVGALSAFSLLTVDHLNDTQIKLTAQCYPGAANRMRILICVLWE